MPKMCAAVPQKIWSCSSDERPSSSNACIHVVSSRLMCAMSQSEPQTSLRVETSDRSMRRSSRCLRTTVPPETSKYTLGRLLETGGWKLKVIDHAADDARVEQDHHAALLGFGIQREIARVVVVAAWIDDLQPSEAAVGELGDLGGFGLIDVDHRERHDQV